MSTIAHAGDYRKAKPPSRVDEKQAEPEAKARSTCRLNERLWPSAEHAAEGRSTMLARYGSKGPRTGNRRPEETGRNNRQLQPDTSSYMQGIVVLMYVLKGYLQMHSVPVFGSLSTSY